MVQQREIVKTQHFNQLGRGALGFVLVQPALELRLRLAGGLLDAGNAVLGQCAVVAFGDKGNLVFQIGQPVVDGRGRQHQHAGFDALFDDFAHQPVVARLDALAGRFFVAKVVAFVNHHQIVIAPVDVAEVDVARGAAAPR